MKTAKFNGKLNLKKETISNLNGETLNVLKGGATAFCLKNTKYCYAESVACLNPSANACNTRMSNCFTGYSARGWCVAESYSD